MGQGALYTVYKTINIYSDSDSALAKSPRAGTIQPWGTENLGNGKYYIDSRVGNSYFPAIALWFVPSSGGSGYSIGWINDTENASPTMVRVGTSGGVVREGTEVWIGVYGGKAKAKEVYVGDANGKPRRAI